MSSAGYTYPGKQLDAAVGECSWQLSGAITTILTQGVLTKIAGTSISGRLRRFTMPASNRLTRAAASSASSLYRVVSVLDMSVVGLITPVDVTIVGLLNGVTQISVPARRNVLTTGVVSIVWQGIVEMSDGDYIEIWASNESGVNNLAVANLSVQVVEI